MTNVACTVFLLAGAALGPGLGNEPLEAQGSSPHCHRPQGQEPGTPRHQCCGMDGPDTGTECRLGW